MEPRLRVTSGAGKGNVYPLPMGRQFTFGAATPPSDIILEDPKLSPAHCRVQNKDGSVTITDLRSAAGVYVNGERVAQRELSHGDVLKLGDTELAYASIGEWNAPSSPAEQKASAGLDATAFFDAPRAHEHVALSDFGLSSTPTSLEDVRQLANTGFGKFHLGPVIGSGHCGVVFRARRHEGTEVALKVLDPTFPHSPVEAAQLKAVTQPRLPLRHPNLVTLIGMGRHNSCTWLALELVEGPSLSQIVSEFGASGLPPWTDAYRLAVHLARALHFAARHQMVHRNVTPANVLYRRLDHLYKLSDLPLAEALAGSQLRQTKQRAKRAAELPYLAPELLAAQAVPDARSDLYALGALTYLMLTGRPPFLGKNANETAALIRDAKPASPRAAQKAMPEDFEAAVFTLLAKRPEDRYSTAAELLRDLARIEPDPE